VTPGTIASDAVLVLDAELERRIAAAARLVDLAPTEFIVLAVQQRCAEVLGERWRSAESMDTRVLWAIRPTPSRVRQIISDVSRVPIETVVRPGRGRLAVQARTVAAYLLHHDAGLSVQETARILHRTTTTVSRLTADVERVLGSSDPRAVLLERARRLFRNGLSSGKQYPPLGPGTTATKLLPGLLAARLAAELTQPELAARAGIARETLARLERLRRRAQPETAERLANALGVQPASLTMATEELPAMPRRARPGALPAAGQEMNCGSPFVTMAVGDGLRIDECNLTSSGLGGKENAVGGLVPPNSSERDMPQVRPCAGPDR